MFVYRLFYYVLLINVEKFTKAADASQHWNDFKIQFNKQYETSEVEQQKMKVYQNNLDKIAKHNEKFKNGEVSFKMGMNHFGDLTEKEFAETYLSKIQHVNLNEISEAQDQKYGSIVTSLPPNSGSVPTSKNRASEGAVTSVKAQGDKCGCCWAFTVIGVIESHYYLKTGHLRSLSEQNLLDCVGDVDQYHHTCEGGTTYYPFQYVIDNEGIDTDKSYPYIQKQNSKCLYKPENKGATIKGFHQCQSQNEKLLKGIVGVVGPVTCAFHAEQQFVQFYESGIYSSTTCGKTVSDINHSMVIVGYGIENNQRYWIMKNSWGAVWGENGYCKVRRGTNECGISIENYYPTF